MGIKSLPYWLIGGLCSLALGIGIMSFGFLALPEELEVFSVLPIGLIYVLGPLGYPLGLVIFFVPGALVGSMAYFLPYRWQRVSLLLIMLLLASAAYGWAYTKNRAQEVKIFHRGYSPADCDRLGDESEIGHCYTQIYRKLPPDPQICKKILLKSEEESDLFGCAEYVGQESGNVELCKQFGGRVDLVENCLTGTALYTGSAAVCSTILDQRQKDKCYYFSAMKSQNASLCDSISSGANIVWSRAICIQEINRTLKK